MLVYNLVVGWLSEEPSSRICLNPKWTSPRALSVALAYSMRLLTKWMSVGFRWNAAVSPAASAGGATVWDGMGADSKMGYPVRFVRYPF